jgi:hypothetical protein
MDVGWQATHACFPLAFTKAFLQQNVTGTSSNGDLPEQLFKGPVPNQSYKRRNA